MNLLMKHSAIITSQPTRHSMFTYKYVSPAAVKC